MGEIKATDLKAKTINGVFWSAVERYSVQGVHFLLQLIIARILTPHDYGLIGMLAIFMSLSQVFIDGGFSNALVQKKDRTDEDFSTVFHINFAISLFIYALLFVSAPLIAEFYNQPLLSPVTRVYSLNLIINALAAVNKVKLVVAIDFKTQSKISFISAVLSGFVGVACAYCGLGVWALVSQILVNSLLNVVLSYYYVRWIPKLFFSAKSFHRLFRYGSKLLVASIINSVSANLYNLVIGKFFSSSTLGLYTRGQQFASFAGTNVSGILRRVAFPVLSELQDDDERLIAAYQKYIKVVSWAAFPVLLGLCGVAKPMIIVLLTAKWAACIPYLQILCFAMLWDCVTIVNLNLLYVKGRSDWVLKLEVIKKTTAFVILLVSMNFGIYAICMGQALYSLVAFFMNTHYTNKLFGYGFFSQMKELMPQFVLSLVMMAICMTLAELISHPMLALLVSVITGVFVYLGGSRMMRMYGYVEFCDIVRHIRIR